MCSVATKETPRKRRSTRLSQTSEDPINGNGIETNSMGEQTEEDEESTTSASSTTANSTPRKRTRTDSLRKSTRHTRLNGSSTELVNGTIEEVDESDTTEQTKSPMKLKIREPTKEKVDEQEERAVDEQENHLKSNHRDKTPDSQHSESTKDSPQQLLPPPSASSLSQNLTTPETDSSLPQLPRSDCLTNILVQALQSGDDAKLMQIINRNQESVMVNTLRPLPQEYVEPLFQSLSRLLHKNGTNQFYISWMRKLFQCKIAHIVNLPEIRNQLLLLSDTLDIRCDLLERCYKLKGRLDLMLSLAETEVKAPQKENIILYEESSSESEDEMNEDGEGDNLMHLLDSDDEQESETGEKTQTVAELDDEELDDLEDAMLED